ncbi:hypothetical protein SADUNF_Sadunf15G0051800 [Salix dunnii]|uniref:Uncharacterized protein n=1 Tax=Salix dunnii TaxID=1413687 RepID=A0A835JG30_9ROSI|nr:hypothetical protein SADUNF_Sadunf15G0051800 [Salix dunnii]
MDDRNAQEQPTLGETNSDEFSADSVIAIVANTGLMFSLKKWICFGVDAKTRCFKSEISSLPFGKTPGTVLAWLQILAKRMLTKLLQAVGLFAGSIFLMRNYGRLLLMR